MSHDATSIAWRASFACTIPLNDISLMHINCFTKKRQQWGKTEHRLKKGYFPKGRKVLKVTFMTRHKIAVFNGPNLNLLGIRQPEVYGSTTLDDVEQLCHQTAENINAERPSNEIEIDFRQTNIEGELVSWIQECPGRVDGIVLNPAAYGHTSIALLDALLTVKLRMVEVHISNIYQREAFRHHSYTAQAARGVICGFGVHGYAMAIRALYDMFENGDE